MFVVKSINNNSSLNSTDLQVVGSISAANLASGTCTIDNLILVESLKANNTTLTTNQLENVQYLDISSSLTDSLSDLNQKIWNVNKNHSCIVCVYNSRYTNRFYGRWRFFH